ncbi:MAG: DUF4062 domain-containing protein, partial [Blastocatellia bacterium]
MAKIYISSTFSDLVEYRKAAYDILCSMDHSVRAMEHYVATDQRPLDKCLADVEACEVYVGIFAWQYGFIPDPAQGNPERRSITELEYRRARETGKPCLIYLLDENHPWPPPKVEKGQGGKKLARFRKELGDAHIVSFFKTPDDLAKSVSVSVANLRPNAPSSAPPDSAKISISRLPVTGPNLFGREAELKLLDDAWADPSTNIVTFVAWGGVGKSALVNHWLARMAMEQYRGAERVFAWSFYSQGTSDERAASADLFIDAGLRWFGDDDPTKGSPWDKGERLANLIRRTRTLLVLDGLEPLQHPPNWAGQQEGKLKDQALQALLRELAAQQRGLCVVSTRLKISDLEGFAQSTVRQEDLDHLSPQAGAQILRAQRVAGDDAELEAASAEFGGHSLALTLLGSYLADVCGGDIRRRGEIGNLEEDERHGGHARRVMAAYEKWLGEGPELAALRLLGLFDRPAPADAVAVLRAAPVIPGLTDALQNLSETKWLQTLSKLRRIKLLAEESVNDPAALDTHPLVREHFQHQLKHDYSDTWHEGNNRLYLHITNTTKELPDTVDEVMKLYDAVAHGCAAGKYQEVFDVVYWPRISRKDEYYAKVVLGLWGADVMALKLVVVGIHNDHKGRVFGQIGYGLRALGRLDEAIEPLQKSMEISVSNEHWEEAALTTGHRAGLLLTQGKFQEGVKFAKLAVAYADRSNNIRQQVVKRAILADAFHYIGLFSKSEALFREAEQKQKENFSDEPLLHSAEGFWFCDLLIDQEKYLEIIDRVTSTSKIANN